MFNVTSFELLTDERRHDTNTMVVRNFYVYQISKGIVLIILLNILEIILLGMLFDLLAIVENFSIKYFKCYILDGLNFLGSLYFATFIKSQRKRY